MKVMISMPMDGKTDEDILKDMKKYRDEFAKLHITVVDSIFDMDEHEGYENVYNKIPLYYLGKSIDLIGKVDAVYFTGDWRLNRGCRIERRVCEEYGVKILDEDFLYPKEIYSVKRLYAGGECYKEIIEKEEDPYELVRRAVVKEAIEEIENTKEE